MHSYKYCYRNVGWQNHPWEEWFRNYSWDANPAKFQNMAVKSNGTKVDELNIHGVTVPPLSTMLLVDIGNDDRVTFDRYASNKCIKT